MPRIGWLCWAPPYTLAHLGRIVPRSSVVLEQRFVFEPRPWQAPPLLLRRNQGSCRRHRYRRSQRGCGCSPIEEAELQASFQVQCSHSSPSRSSHSLALSLSLVAPLLPLGLRRSAAQLPFWFPEKVETPVPRACFLRRFARAEPPCATFSFRCYRGVRWWEGRLHG